MYPQFSLVLVDLNPVQGSEQAGIRPCLIISNTYANNAGRTAVVAIISSVIKEYPHTLIVEPTLVNGLDTRSRIDFLQIRTIDYTRILKPLGTLDTSIITLAKKCLRVSFGI